MSSPHLGAGEEASVPIEAVRDRILPDAPSSVARIRDAAPPATDRATSAAKPHTLKPHPASVAPTESEAVVASSLVFSATTSSRQQFAQPESNEYSRWHPTTDLRNGSQQYVFTGPDVFHRDERAVAEHGFFNRGFRAARRMLYDPEKGGLNMAEFLGRGVSQAAATSYYPAGQRDSMDVASRYGRAIGRDVLMNIVREFWPDVAKSVLHLHPQ